jgi:hypothetical protein
VRVLRPDRRQRAGTPRKLTASMWIVLLQFDVPIAGEPGLSHADTFSDNEEALEALRRRLAANSQC